MKKTTKGVVGLFTAGSMLLVVPALTFGAGTASASCPTDGAQSVEARRSPTR
ncbi:hypothetical protein ACGF1Z_28625 [Streptomyces sp. NPDC048018]|uniref:hypothetical protein n=1 Tax=Streptomyces sp. NPDC048018 TaxID=3365499 RepID=UPI00371185FE